MRLRRRLRPATLAFVALLAAQSAAAQTPAERANQMARSLQQLPRKAEVADRYSIADEMTRLHVTGASVAVVAEGRVVWARGYGKKEFGKPEAVDTTTLFLAGSISKPVFATGVMALVANGTVSLDTNINKLLTSWQLPDSRFTEKDKVTLRRLLSHSAGTTVWGFPGYEVGKPVPTVPQLLDGTPPANTPAVRNDTTPGARWLYSGGGVTVAQLAIADVTHEAFPALMKRVVLDPAGMKRSTYENPIPASRTAETASGHEKRDTVVAGRWHIYPEMAAAGLWTTASDLARWGIAVMHAYRGDRDAILPPAIAREMLRPQIALPKTGPGASPTGWWGIGVELNGSGRDFHFTHGGRDEGFVATVIFFPERDVGLVVMTNATNGSFLNEVTKAFTAAFVQ